MRIDHSDLSLAYVVYSPRETTGAQDEWVMNVFYVMEFKSNIYEYDQIVEACRCEGIFVSRAYSDDVNNL
jgi:hypothetical protein